MDSRRVWHFCTPETGGIQATDTAKFLTRCPVPAVSAAERNAESLDTTREAIDNPSPLHRDIAENQELCAAINQMKEMHGGEGRVTANSSKDDNAATPTINSCQRGHKEKHRVGTCIKAKERINDKRKTFCVTATSFDLTTGLCCVKFDDGEFEEFTNDEMRVFWIVKPFTPRQPSSAANQMTINGFHPKGRQEFASTTNCFVGADDTKTACHADDVAQLEADSQNSICHGLDAGLIFDRKLNRWMACRDPIQHPDPKIQERWHKAGVNEFARLAQGHGNIEGLDVVRFTHRRAMPASEKATHARCVVNCRAERMNHGDCASLVVAMGWSALAKQRHTVRQWKPSNASSTMSSPHQD